MKRKISVRELCVLVANECITEELCRCWNDPQRGPTKLILSAVESWDLARKLRNIFWWLSVFFAVFTMPAVGQDQFAWVFAWGMVMIMLFGSLIAQFVVIRFTPPLARFAQDVVDAYSARLPILGNANGSDLRKAAENILTQLAESIIWTQKGVGIVSQEAEEKRLEFKRVHALFMRFELVPKEWTIFFKEAEKKIAEKEFANRKTAVSVK